MIGVIAGNKLLVCLFCFIEFSIVHENKYAAILNERVRPVKLLNCSSYLFSATCNERLFCFLDCKHECLERFTCVIVVAIRYVFSSIYRRIKLCNIYERIDRCLETCRGSINFILVSGALLQACGFVCSIKRSPGVCRIILGVEQCCLIKHIDKSLIVHLHECALCIYKSRRRVIKLILLSRAYRILRIVKSIDKRIPLKHGVVVFIFCSNELLHRPDRIVKLCAVQLAVLCFFESTVKGVCRIVNVKLISGIYKSIRRAQCALKGVPLEHGIIVFTLVSNELLSLPDRIVKLGVVHLLKICNYICERIHRIVNDTLYLIFTRTLKRRLCRRYCCSELCKGIIGIIICSIEKIFCILNSFLERHIVHKNEHAAILNERVCLTELLSCGINLILISRRKAQPCFVDCNIQCREGSACIIVDSVDDQACIFNRTIETGVIHLDQCSDRFLEIFCCDIYRFLNSCIFQSNSYVSCIQKIVP